MKITILGWYGTETIGDRAILAGLISLFNKSYEKFEIKLGSLYPFFSERTINEDYSFYKEIIEKDIQINIFNSKDSKMLTNAIKTSDLLIMGGGPLMDLEELFMVEYAFKKAKKLGVKTALLGCGVGPLFQKRFRKSVLNISLNSDVVILRDYKSKESLDEIYREFGKSVENHIDTSYDPAVECTLEFNKLFKQEPKDYIAINLREFPSAYNKNYDAKNINEELKNFVNKVAIQFSNREVRLIPMHYFHVGNDDRVFLNQIALELKQKNIKVQNPNLDLKETLEIYMNAYINIGMRFHSVVLQTIVNGNNYVLDYTEPKKGKIFGFLSDIDEDNFYAKRYVSLQSEPIISHKMVIDSNKRFSYEEDKLKKSMFIYIEKLKELIK